MRDPECVALLQWALPRLRLRWGGFRRVRRQVCRRIARRLEELGLAGPAGYRSYLEAHPAEWTVLDGLCRIPISRFYRDRAAWQLLECEALPAVAGEARASGAAEIRCWCIGCAAGEEPYTLVILWTLAVGPRFPGLGLRVVATDADCAAIRRAREGAYGWGSVKDLPAEWRETAFLRTDSGWSLKEDYRRAVQFVEQDVRSGMPQGAFRLVLCRNLVFTYFEEGLQREVLGRMVERLAPGGFLVTGVRERLPGDTPGVQPWHPRLGLYRRAARP